MLAELTHPRQESSPEAVNTLGFVVEFNPDWHYPLAVLPLSGGSTQVSSIPIEGETTLTFKITTPGVTFQLPPSDPTPAEASLPLTLSLGQISNFTDIELSEGNTALSFNVLLPGGPLQPYMFSLAANVEDSFQGLLSNTVLITPTSITPPVSLTLTYSTTSGQFALGPASGWILEPGELITFLRTEPVTDPVTFETVFNLVDETGGSLSGLNFASKPFVCMSPAAPGWLRWEWVDLSRQKFRLVNTVDDNVGIAVPFHFMINYKGMDLRSPDPIIMNATIGDG